MCLNTKPAGSQAPPGMRVLDRVLDFPCFFNIKVGGGGGREGGREGGEQFCEDTLLFILAQMLIQKIGDWAAGENDGGGGGK